MVESKIDPLWVINWSFLALFYGKSYAGSREKLTDLTARVIIIIFTSSGDVLKVASAAPRHTGWKLAIVLTLNFEIGSHYI